MKNKTLPHLLLALGAAASFCAAKPAGAESTLLPFQGRLTDADGNAITGGAKVVQFKIYDAPVGGRAVWNGEVHKLTVNAGLVNTLLGTKADLSAVDFDRNLYLELTIDANDDEEISPADPPLLPRQSILPSFFAKNSADSRLLGGYDWSPLFGTNNPSDGTLLDSKIRDGSISASKLSPQSIHAGLLQSNAVTVSALAQEVMDLLVPPGSIIAFGGAPENVPNGWRLCDGSPARSADHPRLFAGIGTAWGAGLNDSDPETDFNLPDLRGRFLRGVDGGAGVDPDRVFRTVSALGGNTGDQVGTQQGDTYASHNHFVNLSGGTSFSGSHSHNVNRSDGVAIRWGDGGGNSSDRIDAADSDGSDPLKLVTSTAGSHNHNVSLSGTSGNRGGNETRPENAAVHYIIKL